VGDTLPIDQRLARIVLLIAMRSVFDIEAPDEVDRLQGLIGRLLAVAASPMTLMFPFDLPGTTMRTALRTCEEIETVLRGLIAERRPTAHDRTDMLSTMIAARDDDGAALSDDELVSEAYTAFCHDSSTATLTWALFLLDQHPQVLADLRDELSVLGGAAPDEAALDRLPLLDAVLKETMRLLPPAPMLLRYTAGETELGGVALPEKTMVFLSPYVTHRDPERFPRPLRFDPSRWEGPSPSAYEYLPFGAGAHNCVGRHFAMLEMKVVLAVLLQRFRPTLVPGTAVDRVMRVSLVPGNGLPVVLAPAGARIPPPEVSGNIRQSVDLSRL
jgi:cytochrome P450